MKLLPVSFSCYLSIHRQNKPRSSYLSLSHVTFCEISKKQAIELLPVSLSFCLFCQYIGQNETTEKLVLSVSSHFLLRLLSAAHANAKLSIPFYPHVFVPAKLSSFGFIFPLFILCSPCPPTPQHILQFFPCNHPFYHGFLASAPM